MPEVGVTSGPTDHLLFSQRFAFGYSFPSASEKRESCKNANKIPDECCFKSLKEKCENCPSLRTKFYEDYNVGVKYAYIEYEIVECRVFCNTSK